MLLSIQVQLTGSLLNPLDPICLEVRRVHKVHLVQKNTSSDINLDFEENSPFQEGIISEAYQRLNKPSFQEPQKLSNLIDTSNLVKSFYLNKQI